MGGDAEIGRSVHRRLAVKPETDDNQHFIDFIDIEQQHIVHEYDKYDTSAMRGRLRVAMPIQRR